MIQDVMGARRGAARRWGLFAVALLAFSPGAGAQDAAAEDGATELGTVQVTGSRIRQVDLEGIQPLQVFDRATIDRSGAATIQDFLFQQSIAGPNLFNENADLSQLGGTSLYDARGFGSAYTLVLLNGRRLPIVPIAGVSAADLNQIPLAAVERVEFLADSASAVYGADAIAGVINIITKKQYDGLSVTADAGWATQGGGRREGLQFVSGVTTATRNTVFSVDYFDRARVASTDRYVGQTWVSPSGFDGRSSFGFPTSVVLTDPNDPNLAVSQPSNPGDGSSPSAGPPCPAGDIRPSRIADSGTECAFSGTAFTQAVPPSTRYGLLLSHQQDLFADVQWFTEARYSRNYTYVQIAPAPGIAFVPEDSPFNPFGEDAIVARRNVEAGPRITENTNDTVGMTLGLDGYVFGDTRWEVALGSYRAEYLQEGRGVSRSRLNSAFASGQLDPFNLNDPDLFRSLVSVRTFRAAETTLNSATASLDGRLPFSIGGNNLGYALGAEVRNEAYSDFTDALTRARDIVGGAGSDGQGQRKVKAYFLELQAPIGELIELGAAVRRDDYDDIGGKTTYRIGGALRPSDWLLLRTSYSTGFKAPQLGELFLGQSFGVTTAVDTGFCNMVTNDPNSTPAQRDAACGPTEIRSLGGGNSDLQPEESRAWTSGVVVQPVNNLSLSLNYYDIRVDDKIGALSVQEILNNEAQYPDLVNRVNGRFSDPDAFVRSNLQNLQKENTKGIDAGVDYKLPTGIGTFGAYARWTHLLEFNRQASATQPLCDDAGTTNEPENRANAGINWSLDRWAAALNARYLGSTEDDIAGRDTPNMSCASLDPTLIRKVASYTEFDLQGSVDLPWDSSLTLGVNNLFDRDPPESILASGSGGGTPFYNTAFYSNLGRFPYVRLEKRFK